MTFDFDQAVERIMPGILEPSELNEFQSLLLVLTDGFLCGRDYDTNSFVNNNKSGFDLFKSRRKAFKIPSFANSEGGLRQKSFTIGIPAALHLHEDLSFWKHFFSLPVS